jgi:hypothetical protein
MFRKGTPSIASHELLRKGNMVKEIETPGRLKRAAQIDHDNQYVLIAYDRWASANPEYQGNVPRKLQCTGAFIEHSLKHLMVKKD